MADFLCVKTAGLFRQGRTYSFERPTAQALSAARGGILTRVVREPVRKVVLDSVPLYVAKKRGRPKKIQALVEEDK